MGFLLSPKAPRGRAPGSSQMEKTVPKEAAASRARHSPKPASRNATGSDSAPAPAVGPVVPGGCKEEGGNKLGGNTQIAG